MAALDRGRALAIKVGPKLREVQAIQYFRIERDFIVKVGPPKVGQIVRLGGPAPRMMEELYYYESPDIPATETIERHLRSVEETITDAEERFGTSTLLGQWGND